MQIARTSLQTSLLTLEKLHGKAPCRFFIMVKSLRHTIRRKTHTLKTCKAITHSLGTQDRKTTQVPLAKLWKSDQHGQETQSPGCKIDLAIFCDWRTPIVNPDGSGWWLKAGCSPAALPADSFETHSLSSHSSVQLSCRRMAG